MRETNDEHSLAPLLDDLREFADALLQRLLLLAERRRKLLLRRERDLAFGQRGVRRVALLAQIFQFSRERGDLFLRRRVRAFPIRSTAPSARCVSANLPVPARRGFGFQKRPSQFSGAAAGWNFAAR